jgi:hypothetical protein
MRNRSKKKCPIKPSGAERRKCGWAAWSWKIEVQYRSRKE